PAPPLAVPPRRRRAACPLALLLLPLALSSALLPGLPGCRAEDGGPEPGPQPDGGAADGARLDGGGGGADAASSERDLAGEGDGQAVVADAATPAPDVAATPDAGDAGDAALPGDDGGDAAAGPPVEPEPGERIFGAAQLPILELSLTEEERQRLRDAPHEPVLAALRLRGERELQQLAGVGLWLTPRAEGYRTIDQKPNLELDFARIDPAARLQGLARLSLDNLLRDWTLQHRWLASRVFAAAGLPASRIGFVWVRLDGVDYGLYAAAEVADAEWLARHFPGNGTLFVGGGGVDLLPERLDGFTVEQGDAARREGLVALAELCASTAGGGIFLAGAPRLDWDELLRLFAAELYIGSRDGYTLRRGSYFLHADEAGRFSLLPGDATHSFEEQPALHGSDGGLLFVRCLADPLCREQFDQALGRLLRQIDALDPEQQVREQQQRLLAWAVGDLRLEFDQRHISWATGQLVEKLQQRRSAVGDLVRCLLDPAGDPDGDGFRCDGDCDEGDPSTHPGAVDLCGDGKDQDCNGWPDDGPDCPDCTARQRGPHRYLVCTRARSWEEARDHCRRQGSELAVIDDGGEQEWLRRLAREVRPQEYWIGLADREEEGRFTWVDGRAAGYTAWGNGQPDDAGGAEDCVHLLADGGRWNDRPCAHRAGALCEDLCQPDEDGDGDGFLRCGTDCDDGDAEAHPGGLDLCANGKDENCNGVADDGDGCDCTELG
ncbi:MAG: hypothetical protein FJ125_12340, partial [Deltaproteobacteria bacterium]|nr:hypothetical protein [Deltaproteobacteria bacterium]